MRYRHWTTCFTALSMFGGMVLPLASHAQDAPPLAQAGDPPARVGRVASVRGGVVFHDPSAEGWVPATLNYPVSSGSAVQVPAAGRAELQLEGDRFAVPGPGELDVARLDDRMLVATLPRGEACFSLGRVAPGASYAIQTPRGLVRIAAGGHYAVIAGDTATPTTVTVLDGAAEVSATAMDLQVAAGRAAVVTGSGVNDAQGSVSAATPDQCLTDLAAEERAPPSVAAGVAPPLVRQMTGGAELANYGAWQPTPDDGSVWFPRVEAGWVPYRHGHWAFVPPWGWTWCDDAPWGFAPFHYGRWVSYGGRWGWSPVDPGLAEGPPVYAPALVSFFGIDGAALTLGIGAGAVGGALLAGSVGWVPLGPREPYYPWYHASPAYVRQINVSHVSNVTTVVNNYTHNNYSTVVVNRFVNNAGATMVPAAAMARSQPVAARAVPVAAAQLQAARPVLGQMAVPRAPAGAAEGAASAGAFHLPPPARAAQPVAGAPPGPPPAMVARPGVVQPHPSEPVPIQRGAVAPVAPGSAVPPAAPAHPVAPAAPQPEGARPEAVHGAEARPGIVSSGIVSPGGVGPATRPEVARPEVARPEAVRPTTPAPEPPRPAPERPAPARPAPERPAPEPPAMPHPVAPREAPPRPVPEHIAPSHAEPAHLQPPERPAERPAAAPAPGAHRKLPGEP